MSNVGHIVYKGFETEFTVGEACVQVAAVVHGKECKLSDVACTSG